MLIIAHRPLRADPSHPLAGESLLLRLVDRKALAEERHVEKSAQPRIGTNDGYAAADASHPLPRAKKDGQELRVGSVALSEIDDEPRMPKTKREIHTANDSRCPPRLRAANENGRTRQVRALLANLDHRRGVPSVPRIETPFPLSSPLAVASRSYLYRPPSA